MRCLDRFQHKSHAVNSISSNPYEVQLFRAKCEEFARWAWPKCRWIAAMINTFDWRCDSCFVWRLHVSKQSPRINASRNESRRLNWWFYQNKRMDSMNHRLLAKCQHYVGSFFDAMRWRVACSEWRNLAVWVRNILKAIGQIDRRPEKRDEWNYSKKQN